MATLDERKAAILRAIVEDYVRHGEPVGSKRLVEEWNLGVSAATVRAEMAALEEAGFITHPHTSAGRIPTDKGYRYFVDTLTQTQPVAPAQRAALEGLLLQSSDLEDLLRRTSGVLSGLTHVASLVAAPSLDRSRMRHIELVRLAGTAVLLVMIAETGRVEKRILDLDRPVEDHDVQRARHTINEVAGGLRTGQVPETVAGVAEGAPPELQPLLHAVADAVRQGLVDAPSGRVFVGGTANLASPGFFAKLEQVKQVHETLEEQVVLLTMLREALAAGEPAVRIGAELPLAELAECSVVATRYEATGEATGSLGVLGPTRMDYGKALSAVETVAASLEKALAQLTGGG